MKSYQDEESLVHSFGRHKLEREIIEYRDSNKTLEDKLQLIDENFNLSDEKYSKYSSMKFKLNNGKLFLGEATRYRKELRKMEEDLFNTFKKTWGDLIRYGKDIPSNKFKTYRVRYNTYNYNPARNRFNN